MASIFSMPSNFGPFNLFQDIGFFDPSIVHLDSKTRQFNEIANFLRNLQHCQFLYRYRKTNLLKFLFNCLNDSTFEWLKKRSHFDSLHIFSTVLTTAFSSQLKARVQKLTKRKARKIAERAELKTTEIAKSTSKLQNIDIFDSTACNESEFELYSKVAIFLQHLQQCQHLYRKSDLLNLLSKCLCDLASEWFKTQSEFISLKRFSKVLAKAFSEASSRRASSRSSNLQLRTLDVISKSMKNASDRQVVQMICKICKQSFNSNEKLYEHIRNHEALKSVKNSHLSINAINLVCEIEKKSFVTHVSSASSARSQNSIFESATAFRSVTLLKRSILSSFTLDVVSIRMKNESLQCSSISSQNSIQDDVEIDTQKSSAISSSLLISTTNFTCKITERPATCRHCKQTFKFKELLRKHKREQHAKRSAVSSHFLIDAVKSACESMKISTVNSSSSVSLAVQSKQVSELFTLFELSLFASLDIFNSARSHQNSEKRRFNQIVIFIQHLQQCQHLYDESELLEWMKVILCDSVDIWFENQSNFIFLHDFDIALTKTFSERSSLSLSTLKTESKSTKRSTTCRHCKQTFKFKELLRKHKREQHAKKSVINSSFQSHALKSVCKAKKKSAVKNVTTLLASQELQISAQKSQKIDVQKSSVISSSLSASTINSTCKVAEKSTITSIAEASELISEQRVEWRSRTVYLFTRLKASRLNLSLNTFITRSETVKNASIQRVTCARAMCKSCKQNFNFSEKFFEHIREHEALKRVNKIKSTCEAMNKSAIACSHSSQKSLISFATSRNFVTDTRLSWQSVSSKDSNLSITTLKVTSERVKSASIRQVACVRICKHCKQNFNFNNKLHDHIRKHHARKSVKSLNLRVFASKSTCNIKKKSAFTCSSASLASSILSATSRSQKFWFSMIFESVTASTRSNLSIATYKISSKSMRNAIVNCSLTSSSTSSNKSVRKHRESHIQKFYLTMNDLSRMFHEKSKSFDLRQHHNRRFSSQSFDIRQSHFSSSSIKSHLTIENLFEMFDEKFRKKSLFQNQKNVSSREFFSNQARITIYFKPTVNQKSSINRDSKNSKSKSLNQHMSAKFIRTALSENSSEKSIDLSFKLSDFFYSKDLSENSVNLSYKLLDVFCINLKPSVETPFFIFVLLRLLPIFLLALAFVSIISAARMNCINAYEQVISIIDRAIQ